MIDFLFSYDGLKVLVQIVLAFSFVLNLANFVSHRLALRKINRESKEVENFEPKEDRYLQPGSKVLVFVNPRGGDGCGWQKWTKVGQPLFDVADVETSVIKTNRAGHATEFFEHLGENFFLSSKELENKKNAALSVSSNLTLKEKELALIKFDAIAVLGGDGFLHEAINGLCAGAVRGGHTARDLLESQCLIVIPGGTSNGLAANFNLRHFYESCTKVINSTKPTKVDLYRLQNLTTNEDSMWNTPGEVKYDAHVFSWAIIGDHDLYVEHTFRSKWFTLPKVVRELAAPAAVIVQFPTYKGKAFFLPAPINDTDPDYIKEIKYKNTSTLASVDSDDGESCQLLEENGVDNISEWKIVDDDVTCFTVSNARDGSYDAVIAPGATLNDGYFDVLVIRKKNLTRMQLINMFLHLDDGSFIDLENVVSMYKVKDMFLYPENGNYMTASGEALASPGSVVPLRLSAEESMAQFLF